LWVFSCFSIYYFDYYFYPAAAVAAAGIFKIDKNNKMTYNNINNTMAAAKPKPPETTIASKIKEGVVYVETKNLEKMDLNHVCSLYEIEVQNVQIAIALGKVRFHKKGVAYCPIYAVGGMDARIRSQIGVAETPEAKARLLFGAASGTTSDHDVQLETVDHLLFYSFVTTPFLIKMNSRPELYHQDTVAAAAEPPKLFKPRTPEFPPPPPAARTPEFPPPPPAARTPEFLPLAPPTTEETEAEARELQDNYKENSGDNWVQKFMRNPHFRIVSVEGNGDCYFATVREAFAARGQVLTVATLRAVVAAHMTEALFQTNRSLYTQLREERDRAKREIKELEKTVTQARDELKKNPVKNEDQIKQVNEHIREYNKRRQIYKNSDTLFNEFDYMKNIKNLQQYKDYILTSAYWADAWAIHVLEREYKYKTIILSEEAYKEKSLDNILQCGETSMDEQIDVDYYTMVSYTGNHYDLISYKNKHLLTFQDIPYDIKSMVVKKCMERNSGEFDKIAEFRAWKQKHEAPEPAAAAAAPPTLRLGDPDVVFVFYENSPAGNAPGKGPAEKIKPEMRGRFMELAAIKDWRRQLDDAWSLGGAGAAAAPLFTHDGRQWKTVVHYMLGAQFKKGHPDIYNAFSLNANTDVAQDVDKARKSINRKKGEVVIQGEKKRVQPDAGFYGEMNLEKQWVAGTEKTEREHALRAKFEQNQDLKKVLFLTRPATLMHFIRAQPPEIDELLMSVRELL
jgi:predicted NAD-dependent protein-ADP-ribosyltransferase YbiA (DUF1768 family)